MSGGALRLQWRSFRLPLAQPLATARGVIRDKRGWMLRLEVPDGGVGWGEAAPLDPAGLPAIAAAIEGFGTSLERTLLEAQLKVQPAIPGALAFALGAALAELDGLPRRRWLAPPPAARLLPAGAAALPAFREALASVGGGAGGPEPAVSGGGATFKWKVAVHSDDQERALLEQLLQVLPAHARLRLDANGGWDRATALAWAERLAFEPRLEWLEQPLPPQDQAGLEELAGLLPVALDESLQLDPSLAPSWPGWQVRRPSQEGDPRPLLAALEAGQARLMLSTAFETGIGRRWLEHLAALQAEGPTPAAPGLAPGWLAAGGLGASDPEAVWEAAA